MISFLKVEVGSSTRLKKLIDHHSCTQSPRFVYSAAEAPHETGTRDTISKKPWNSGNENA